MLTTAVADIAEFLNGGVVLVDPPSPETLLKIWKDIIDDPGNYARTAAAGQALVLERCSVEHTGFEIATLLKCED